MKLRASKKSLEDNRMAPILPEKPKEVQVSIQPILDAQKGEFLYWLEQKAQDSSFVFFSDMFKRINNGQVLTPNMITALRRCMGQDAERSNPDKPVDEKDLPTMTFKMKQFWTKKNDLGSRVITGKVLRETHKAYLLKGHADMVEGSWCMRCGRELTEPASMVIGYGAICCAKLGVDYPSDILTSSKKERLAIRKKLMTVLHNQTFEAWVPKSQIEEIIEKKGSKRSE